MGKHSRMQGNDGTKAQNVPPNGQQRSSANISDLCVICEDACRPHAMIVLVVIYRCQEGKGSSEFRREHEMGNARQILDNVNARIAELEDDSTYVKYFPIRYVCDELSIFDWWTDRLSLSQLKAMRTFLRQAIKMGFDGYVCFKVGAKGCSSGMWAHKEESTTGYSPAGDFLYRSFYSTDNYWDAQIDGEFVTKSTSHKWNDFRTVAQLRKAMAA